MLRVRTAAEGPWTGQLAPLTQRMNPYELLSYADAVLAKSLLPREWPDNPHSQVTFWALYEIAVRSVPVSVSPS